MSVLTHDESSNICILYSCTVHTMDNNILNFNLYPPNSFDEWMMQGDTASTTSTPPKGELPWIAWNMMFLIVTLGVAWNRYTSGCFCNMKVRGLARSCTVNRVVLWSLGGVAIVKGEGLVVPPASVGHSLTSWDVCCTLPFFVLYKHSNNRWRRYDVFLLLLLPPTTVIVGVQRTKRLENLTSRSLKEMLFACMNRNGYNKHHCYVH